MSYKTEKRDLLQKNNLIEQEETVLAQNYHPLPVVLSHGKGTWIWDVMGNRYLDMMSAYSAVSHGHCHPKILDVFVNQAQRLCIPSRAYHNDRLYPFLKKLCEVTQQDMAIPMNTGAEAVETAIKAARLWGYRSKGIDDNKAEIIVAENNFHGRTTTIVGFSSDPVSRDGFGPYSGGFKAVPFGDAKAIEQAITQNTCAVMIEPIQGEAGIIVPPAGYLRHVKDICEAHNVLLILDEIQSGLGRTGKMFAYQHEEMKPDAIVLGKALGGGVMPVSAFLGRREIMELFTPGTHGSTFGGNPLGAAVALEALKVLENENLVERSKTLGDHMMSELSKIDHPAIKEIRGKGLWIGVELDANIVSGRALAKDLLEKGVLTKETHETTLRFAPPLVITKDEIDWGLTQVRECLTNY